MPLDNLPARRQIVNVNARATLGTRAEKTHAAILEAAEDIFALKGFAATRLEDIAEKVGIKRASLVYYYPDKQALYAEVLKEVFGDLYEKVSAAFGEEGPLAARIEAISLAWVDYLAARPSLPRLLLREIADASPRPSDAILKSVMPFFQMIQKGYMEGVRQVKRPADPAAALAFCSVVSGATIFQLAAIPALSPAGIQMPTGPQIERLRSGISELVRVLLAHGGLSVEQSG
ncbi:MAG: TetR family transcriptional regulator [Deltaproteobacteria bacterium]|nr:TetR family transcriptional regulator [Deltaproteobacteria bacterium]